VSIATLGCHIGCSSRFRSKTSERLLSADTHSNTANFRFTYSVEIVPICKDDLVCLPVKLARQLGNIDPLTVCTRVGNSLHFLHPSTLQSCELIASTYWRALFDSLATASDLLEFVVLDVEPSGNTRGKWVMADAQVALSGAFRSTGTYEDDRMMDYETAASTNQIFHTRTHLGGILQPGDAVMGYHLSNSNFNSDDFANLPQDRIPDVILVRKAYPNRRKKNKSRNWRLRSIAKEEGEEGETGGGRGAVGRMGGRDQKKVEEDYELFLRDLEEDPEMRSAINLYKEDATKQGKSGSRTSDVKTRKKTQHAMDVDEVAAPVPEPVSEADEEDEAEVDFPEVKLDELLENFDEMTLGEEEED
jgi:nonsense-mediated mRNA decay protein 3